MRIHKTILTSAVALIAVSASSGNAAVISFIDQAIPIPTTYEGVSVNLETGAIGLALAGLPAADMNFVFGGSGITNDADQTSSAPTWQPVRAGTGNTDAIQNLGLTTIVGPTSVVSSGFGGSMDNFTTFTSGELGYIGFSLVLEDATVAYGWAEVTLQNDNTPRVIHSWAFEDSGVPLAVGVVPEPTQSVLLLFGLLLPALRRHR